MNKNKRLLSLTGLTKEQIRSKILLRLKTQKEDIRGRKSRAIKEKLFRTKIFKKAKRVMFYISFHGEVKTEEMIEEARNLGKIIAVPTCRKNRRAIRPCILHQNTSLKKGPYGIWEPAVKKTIPIKDLDLVIVPGVAFDRKGIRLGRGKGYYDRFLKKFSKSIPTIGLSFDFQILPSVPATKHDVNVKRVIFA
jgi:5-formyltetrahydrofolate cyclo-ligase